LPPQPPTMTRRTDTHRRMAAFSTVPGKTRPEMRELRWLASVIEIGNEMQLQSRDPTDGRRGQGRLGGAGIAGQKRPEFRLGWRHEVENHLAPRFGEGQQELDVFLERPVLGELTLALKKPDSALALLARQVMRYWVATLVGTGCIRS